VVLVIASALAVSVSFGGSSPSTPLAGRAFLRCDSAKYKTPPTSAAVSLMPGPSSPHYMGLSPRRIRILTSIKPCLSSFLGGMARYPARLGALPQASPEITYQLDFESITASPYRGARVLFQGLFGYSRPQEQMFHDG
jgi:hypothetical protein